MNILTKWGTQPIAAEAYSVKTVPAPRENIRLLCLLFAL